MIRPIRTTSVVGPALAALVLAGCAITPVTSSSATPTSAAPASSSAVATPSTPPTSSGPASSAAVPTSASATAPTSVKATGSLDLFAPTSDALAGTCATTGGVPTLTLSDRANDFFDGVDVTVRLDAAKAKVAAVSIHLGADSEEYVRDLSYTAANPAKGTSSTLKVSGRTYTVSGKLAVVETKGSKRTTSLMPYALKVTCAPGAW